MELKPEVRRGLRFDNAKSATSTRRRELQRVISNTRAINLLSEAQVFLEAQGAYIRALASHALARYDYLSVHEPESAASVEDPPLPSLHAVVSMLIAEEGNLRFQVLERRSAPGSRFGRIGQTIVSAIPGRTGQPRHQEIPVGYTFNDVATLLGPHSDRLDMLELRADPRIPYEQFEHSPIDELADIIGQIVSPQISSEFELAHPAL